VDKRCQAMVNAGIENPESQEGIDFCVNSCPYDYCVVFENISGYSATRLRNVKVSKALRKLGVSKEDIAKKLGRTVRTIERYLGS